MTSGTFFVYSQEPTVAFLVISTNTGPGRPSFAIWNALRIVGANSSGDLQIKLCLVIGIVTPLISISWKASLPKALTPTLAVKATKGIESIMAVAIPVTRLVAPGPLVAIQTPTLPVARA